MKEEFASVLEKTKILRGPYSQGVRKQDSLKQFKYAKWAAWADET
jgi:hypothetical protein